MHIGITVLYTHTRTHTHVDESIRIIQGNLRVAIVPDNALRIWCTLQDTGEGREEGRGRGGREDKLLLPVERRVSERGRGDRVAHCQRRKSDAAWAMERGKQTMKERDWDRQWEGGMEKESLSGDWAANRCCRRRNREGVWDKKRETEKSPFMDSNTEQVRVLFFTFNPTTVDSYSIQ